MVYRPSRVTTITTVEELKDYIDDEFAAIATELGETIALELRPVFVAPKKPREGMLVFADGTQWNPGSGRGTYEYRSGAWVKL